MTNEKLKAMVDRLNADKSDSDAADVLDRWLSSRACCKPGVPLEPGDLRKTLDFLEALDAHRAVSGRYATYQTLTEWRGLDKPRTLDLDPSVDAVALDPDGWSQDAAAVCWAKVSKPRRLLVLLGRDSGKLAHHPDPEKRHAWAQALEAPQLPAQPWGVLEEALASLTPRAREDLEQRLVRVVPPKSARGGTGPAPSVQGGLVVLHHTVDDKHADRLKTHLGNPPYYWDHRSIVMGTVRAEVRGRMLVGAKVVVHLITPEYAADFTKIAEALTLAPNARHVPVLVRTAALPVLLKNAWLLPRNERPLITWPDQDSAWAEVARDVQLIMST